MSAWSSLCASRSRATMARNRSLVKSSIFLEGNESVSLRYHSSMRERLAGWRFRFCPRPRGKECTDRVLEGKRDTAQVGPASETQDGHARKSQRWHRRFGAYGPDSHVLSFSSVHLSTSTSSRPL